MRKTFRQILPAIRQSVWQWVWIAFILILPITSLPLVAHFAGSDVVAAPSALVLLLLGIGWFLPAVVKGSPLSRISIPLLVFVAIAVAATAASFFADVPPFKDRSLARQTFPALLTLGIGMAFYWITASWAESSHKIRTTLFWINLSGAAILVWSILQAGAYALFHDYPAVFNRFQALVSLHELYPQRVTGFAFEPSWLAHQLNMLYLPFWLAESVQGFTVYRFRLWKLTVENVLLAAGVATLYLSVSRVGWVAFSLMVGWLVLQAALKLVRWLKPRLLAWLHIPARWSGFAGGVAAVVLLLAILAGSLGIVYLTGLIASHYESRMARLFNIPRDIQGFNELAAYLAVASRLIYWDTGWSIFNDHSILGVGLGNAGFYFPSKLPAFGWNLIEVQQIFFTASYLPNIKSLWIRLLAETGALGFTAFVCWIYLLAQAGRFLLKSRDSLLRMVGQAGVLALLALLIEGFSIDSFALPYYWVSFGLLTAAAEVYRRSLTRSRAAVPAQTSSEAGSENNE